MGRRRARRQHFTEHRDLLVGVENLAQYIGAGSLSADHHEQMTAARRRQSVSRSDKTFTREPAAIACIGKRLKELEVLACRSHVSRSLSIETAQAELSSGD